MFNKEGYLGCVAYVRGKVSCFLVSEKGDIESIDCENKVHSSVS